jgi:hypothetical protein
VTASKALIIFMRAAIAVQLILGIVFWTGNWAGLVPVHMIIGLLFVLALWAVAGIAIARRRNSGLAVLAFVLGLLIAWLGMTQRALLVGDLHWIVRVVHLLLGIAAMPIAERLAADRAVAVAA